MVKGLPSPESCVHIQNVSADLSSPAEAPQSGGLARLGDMSHFDNQRCRTP